MKSTGLSKIDDKSKFFIEYPSELESVLFIPFFK